MIDTRTVQTLIQIGREGTAESPIAVSLLQIIRHADHSREHIIGCSPGCGPDGWYSIAIRLTVADLNALVKGLTLAEEALGCSGSSVSAVIWTYRVLEQRCGGSVSATIGTIPVSEQQPDPHLLRVTTNWILQHTRNPYVPFGGRNKGAKSLEEYHELCRLEQEHKRISQERQQLKEEEQQRAASIRRQARSIASKEHTAKAGQRREERPQLIAELAAMDPASRLQCIAEATGPLGLYPEEWADESDAILRSLPVAVRLSLVKRLQGRRGGQWRLLLDRLRALESRES